MPNPSSAEAAEHLDRAISEAQRLGEHFSQRTKEEKKRMSHLQQLVPKLKRLAKSHALDKPLSTDEQKVLESLKPAAPAAQAAAAAAAPPAASKAPSAPKAPAAPAPAAKTKKKS